MQGVSVPSATFTVRLVYVLKSSPYTDSELPLVIVGLLMCNSCHIADTVKNKLATEIHDPLVQHLQNNVLMISMDGQWSGTESLCVIDCVMRLSDPTLGTSQVSNDLLVLRIVTGGYSWRTYVDGAPSCCLFIEYHP